MPVKLCLITVLRSSWVTQVRGRDPEEQVICLLCLSGKGKGQESAECLPELLPFFCEPLSNHSPCLAFPAGRDSYVPLYVFGRPSSLAALVGFGPRHGSSGRPMRLGA